jgi:hypothetical protein
MQRMPSLFCAQLLHSVVFEALAKELDTKSNK